MRTLLRRELEGPEDSLAEILRLCRDRFPLLGSGPSVLTYIIPAIVDAQSHGAAIVSSLGGRGESKRQLHDTHGVATPAWL